MFLDSCFARRCSAIPGFVVVVVLLAPVTAEAAAATCRGQAATLLGGPVRIVGTPGADVIVTNGSSFVNAGGGDDLVCVTGEADINGQVDIYAGSGNDVIDSTAAPNWNLNASLGQGADQLVSGFANDQVFAGLGGNDGDLFGASDSEADTISTGDGADFILSGDFTDSNADIIDAGPGQDSIGWLGERLGTGGLISGGDGPDIVTFHAFATKLMALDNSIGVGTTDGVAYAAWNQIETFIIDASYGPREVSFVGGPGDEHLRLPPGPAQVSMGAGNDTVELGGALAISSSYTGGEGTDRLRTIFTWDRLWLDMASGRLDVGRTRGDVGEGTVEGFETVRAVSRRSIWLRGTSGPDTLRPQACLLDVAGRGGADRIRPGPGMTNCGDVGQHATLSGGAGADEIFGTRGDDRVLGGAGRDTADGRPGEDLCRTEVRTRCER